MTKRSGLARTPFRSSPGRSVRVGDQGNLPLHAIRSCWNGAVRREPEDIVLRSLSAPLGTLDRPFALRCRRRSFDERAALVATALLRHRPVQRPIFLPRRRAPRTWSACSAGCCTHALLRALERPASLGAWAMYCAVRPSSPSHATLSSLLSWAWPSSGDVPCATRERGPVARTLASLTAAAMCSAIGRRASTRSSTALGNLGRWVRVVVPPRRRDAAEL